MTFGFNKRGIIMFPGALYSGKVITEDIGFPDIAVQKAAPGAYTYNKTDIENLCLNVWHALIKAVLEKCL